MEEKEKLLFDASKASRIKETLATRGWADIEEYFFMRYEQSLQQLIEKESEKDRATISVIEGLLNDLGKNVKCGELATKKYREKYLNVKVGE
jgi:hypothetical protein